MEKISVAIRVRPPSKAPSPSPYLKGFRWMVGPHNLALYNAVGTPVTGQNHSFERSFDFENCRGVDGPPVKFWPQIPVFGADTKNEDIYKRLTKHVIKSSIDGFNGTVFAYGQTSSGKTYTMKGSPTDPGIIRLAVHDVFDQIRQLESSREFLIRVSYMEIYNEDINDLFAPDNRKLRIHENIEKGIFAAGLREEIVDSPEQILDLLEHGENHRHFGETNMNLYSSRSHTIFRMVIESRDKSQDGIEAELSSDAVRVSCLNMVDLAGSERVAKTGAGGVRLKEGTHINKSLMTLGTVINKLSDGTGKQGGHIPYRDSKLTRILQPALGGNAKTVMICTVNSDEIHIDETRGTLQFASRAKRVSTCAHVNEIVTDAALLKRQTKEIEELRMKLQGLPQSVQLETEIRSLRNELLKFESEKEKLLAELEEKTRSEVEKERRIKEQEQKIENLSTFFTNSTIDERVSPGLERLSKKHVNRRETWCPRPTNSQLAVQDFRKSSTDQIEDDETMDNILFSVRRDRTYTLPPAFEIEEETDPFWAAAGGIESTQPPVEFENIADEDTWMSLNKGHTTSSTVFTPGFSDRNTMSVGNDAGQKVPTSQLESQLQDLQAKHKELEGSCDLKIQKATEEMKGEVWKLEKQLDKVQDENHKLKESLLSQLEMYRELQGTLEDLEFEVDAARLQFGSLQGIVAESLHVQATVLLSVQDCTIVTTKPPVLSSKEKERRLSMENSVQQCRQIFSEVDKIFIGRPVDIEEVGTTGPSIPGPIDNGISCYRDDDAICNLSDCVENGLSSPKGDEVHQDQNSDSLSPSAARRTRRYCQSCLAPVLVPSQGWGEDAASSGGDAASLVPQYGVANESILCHTASGAENRTEIPGTSCCQRHGSCSLQEHSLCLSSSTAIKAHVLKAVASDFGGDSGRSRSSGTAGDDPAHPLNIWNKMISCQHAGCSFGTLGGNCNLCGKFERNLARRNQIPAEMQKLYSSILRLLRPSPSPASGSLIELTGGPREGELQEKGNLKMNLATAKLLATWLHQELQVIMGHDGGCLISHVKERGNVGILLEAFQVILLQLSSLSVGLLQVFLEDGGLRKDLLLQLDAFKNVQTEGQNAMEESVKAATTEIAAETRARTPEAAEDRATAPEVAQTVESAAQTTSRTAEVAETTQGATTVHAATSPRDCPKSVASFQVDSSEVPESSTSNMLYSERVVKVEGVEELLGRVLPNSIVLRSTEHRVVSGGPMLLVLTLELEKSPEKVQDVLAIGGEEFLCSKVQRIESRSKSGEMVSLPEAISAGANTIPPEEDVILTDTETTLDNRGVGPNRYLEVVLPCSKPDQLSCRKGDLFESKREETLEMKLAAAEMENIELKIEIEDLRAKLETRVNMSHIESAQQMEVELESYKARCVNFEHEMSILLAASPNSWEHLERERRLVEITEENQFLQDCLAKTKKHVLRSKAWRDEMRKWKGIQDTKRETLGVSQSLVLLEGFHDILSSQTSEKPSRTEKMGSRRPPPLYSQPTSSDNAVKDPKATNRYDEEEESSYEVDDRSGPHFSARGENWRKEQGKNRLNRSVLRSMDVNLLDENYVDHRHCPKGKRQLQFREEERR